MEPTNEASGNAWGAGSGAETRLPPPPPAPAYSETPASSLALAPPPGESGPTGWRKFFAITGIVFAFPFLLTIPGWVALSAYRKWKAGERGQPTILIIWGILGPVLFVLLSVVQLTLLTDSRIPSVPVESPAGGAGSGDQRAPDGFVASSGPNGWTRYESDAHGFSISLPPEWSPDLISDPGPQYKFIARDWGPPYRSDPGAGLWVSVWSVSGQEVPRTYWESVRFRISQDPHTVSVEVSRIHLPAGNAFVFHVVTVRRGVSGTTTMFALLHGATDYRLLFEAPLKHAGSYRSEFNNIARTFTPAE